MEIKWRALSDITVIIPCSFILVVKTYICAMCAQSLQLCLSLCDPMDSTPPGSSVHGILQARILGCQWVAMPSTRVSFWPRSTINQEKGQFNSSWVAYVIKGCLQDWIRKLFFFYLRPASPGNLSEKETLGPTPELLIWDYRYGAQRSVL